MIDPSVKDAIRSRLSEPRDVARALALDTHGADGREQRQAGGGVFVLCPWHSEKHPSCSLTRGPDGTLRAHCFTCGEGGDVFALLAAVRSLDVARDFPEVLNQAGALAGVDVASGDSRPVARAPRPPPPPPFAPVAPAEIGAGDRAFAALVAPLLHLGRLDGSEVSRDVCAYLQERRLLDVARAEGWAALPPEGSEAARSWCAMLRDVAADLSPEHDAANMAIELAALVRDDGRGFIRPAHRLVIPFRAPCGTVYTWQRRALDNRPDKYAFPRSRDADHGPGARGGTGRAARWPYGIERLAAAPATAPLVYTEGALDAAAVRALDAAAGRARVVLGVPGTSGFPDYFATFARGRTAAVATDADAANKQGKRPGEEAAKAWGAALWRAGALDVQRERPIGSKDWGEALATLRGERAA